MKKIVIISFLLTLFACPMPAQVDSLNTASGKIQVVTLDPTSKGRLESIDDSAKPYSLKELFHFPKGPDSVNLGFWIALIALLFSVFTFGAQRQTEKHTKNVPIRDQREKFKDLSRHEYRNLCCIMASAIKFFDSSNGTERHRKYYPSESNLQKLKVEPEDIVLSIDSDVASLISELRLLLRNYNIEIDIASEHLSKQNLVDATLYQDFDNLFFKPFYLVKRAYDLEIALVNNNRPFWAKTKYYKRTDLYRDWYRMMEKTLLDRTMETIIIEHLKKIKFSLPSFVMSGNTGFISLLQTVEGFSFPSVDHYHSTSRSIIFLLRNGEGEQLSTNIKLTNKIRELAESVKLELQKIQDNDEVFFSQIEKYYSVIDSLLSSDILDFMTIFPTMIAVDAIVETYRIGMVNYE